MNFVTKFITFLKKGKKSHKIRRIRPSNSSKGIAIIDTNLVPIPKYNSLSKEEKQQVKKYYSELTFCNPSAILKYGRNCENAIDTVSQIIIKILFTINSATPKYNVKRFKDDPDMLFKNLTENEILTMELEQAISEIYKIREEVYLRAVALERYLKIPIAIRKEDKIRFLFFSKNRNLFEESFRNLLFTITNMELQINGIRQTIASSESLKTSTSIYRQALSTYSLQNYYYGFISQVLSPMENAIGREYQILYGVDDNLNKSLDIKLEFISVMAKSYNTLPCDKFEELILKSENCMAKQKFRIDWYIVSHQNAKEEFLKEIDAIIENESYKNIEQMKIMVPYLYRMLCIIKGILFKDSLSSEEENELLSKYLSIIPPIFCEEFSFYMAVTEEDKLFKPYRIIVPEEYKKIIVKQYLFNNFEAIMRKYCPDGKVPDYRKGAILDYITYMFINNHKDWIALSTKNLLYDRLFEISETESSANVIKGLIDDLHGKLCAFGINLFNLEGLVIKGPSEKISIWDLFVYIRFSNGVIEEKKKALEDDKTNLLLKIQLNNTTYSDEKIIYTALSQIFINTTEYVSRIKTPEFVSNIQFFKYLTIIFLEHINQKLTQYFCSKCSLANLPGTVVAFFPEMIKGIYSSSEQQNNNTTIARHLSGLSSPLYNTHNSNIDTLTIDLPKELFNERTIGIFIHDDFDVSNFYRIILYVPNLKYIIFSRKRFEEYRKSLTNGDVNFIDILLGPLRIGRYKYNIKQITNGKIDVEEIISSLKLLIYDSDDLSNSLKTEEQFLLEAKQ